MSVSLLFPAFNRLEFTKQAWAALMANTDWSLVSEFHVYDDGSTDGTREWLDEVAELPDRVLMCGWQERTPQQCEEVLARQRGLIRHHTKFRSPMGVTLDWIRRSRAPFLAKLDNDTIYPPGWLNVALGVMEQHPELGMLGLECMRQPVPFRFNPHVHDGRVIGVEYKSGGAFGYLPAQYVSGLFLARREVFASGLPEDNGYFGLEEFQVQRRIKAGWILPSLPTFLLDRLPMEPWKSLSESYVKKGWQRPWSGAGPLRYKPEQHEMWSWWEPV